MVATAVKLAIEGGTPVRATKMPAQYPGATMIGEEEKRAVLEVLDRRSPFRYYGPDPAFKVAQLEQEFAAMHGVKHALGVTSCTAALICSLRALGVGPGDEVIVPAATFIATAGAAISCYAVPVFVDVDEDVHIDPEAVQRAITPRTKAIIPVHWRGMSVDMDALLAVANRHGVPVLEDCAQSMGATYKGRLVGSIGTINAFSFQMNKVLSAGEGGIVTTDDSTLYARANAAHDQGAKRKRQGLEVPAFFGENYRLNELSGAVLLEQVRKLDQLRTHARRMGAVIAEAVSGLPGVRMRRGADPDGAVGVSCVLAFESAALFSWASKALRAEGTPIAHPYGGEPAYWEAPVLARRVWHNGVTPWDPVLYKGDVRYEKGMCPRAEAILPRVGEFRISWDWTEQEARDVAAAVRKVMHSVPADLRPR